MALFLFGLPGSCYVYNGQELGLPDAELADSDRQDPTFFRTNGETKGRDGARVPMPWSGEVTPFGFSSGKPWLPLPAAWKNLSVEAQSSDPQSTLSLYRNALSLRGSLFVGATGFTWDIGKLDQGVIGYSRNGIQVYANAGNESVQLLGTEVILCSSGQSFIENSEVELKPGRAIWFKR
jgi:alpha-glucosidase